jgi:Fe-S-cluster containining protein
LHPRNTDLRAASAAFSVSTAMKDTLLSYGKLLAEIDSWFAGAVRSYPEHIRCGKGCSGCCRALFDITLLDALYLQQGFRKLSLPARERVLAEAERRLAELCRQWPELSHPYLLNHRSEEEWQELMPEDDETPCLLLDSEGHCLVYEHRPMTCRLHGLPLIDVSGELMHDEWCTENFTAADPLALAELRGEFDRFFREEVRLDRELSLQLFGRVIYELDTLIPAALLIDFSRIKT